MRLIGLKSADGRWIARRLHIASSFRHRLRGLLGTRHLPPQEGLMLSPGGSVHTFGMRYSIDVAFLDRQLKILRLAPQVSPWRFCRAPARTRHVLELPAGTVQQLQLQENTFVCIDHDLPARATTCARHSVRRPDLRFSLRIPQCSRQRSASGAAIKPQQDRSPPMH
jgi:uncharacterized membrane protein (UPF0127 family)